MNNRGLQRANINKITLGAILSAFSLMLLLGAQIIPGVELTFYALASVLPAFMIIEMKGKGGFALYIVVSLLAFFLLPNKLAVIPYIMFFGIYGIIKYYIEKLNSPVMQILAKAVVFMGMFTVAYFFSKGLFFANINLPELATPLLYIGALLMLFLYDAIFTEIINLYLKKIHPHIR